MLPSREVFCDFVCGEALTWLTESPLESVRSFLVLGFRIAVRGGGPRMLRPPGMFTGVSRLGDLRGLRDV